jgi:hypothetical protein
MSLVLQSLDVLNISETPPKPAFACRDNLRQQQAWATI